jgi:hypothetical protein
MDAARDIQIPEAAELDAAVQVSPKRALCYWFAPPAIPPLPARVPLPRSFSRKFTTINQVQTLYTSRLLYRARQAGPHRAWIIACNMA